jgi:hypothetical protein
MIPFRQNSCKQRVIQIVNSTNLQTYILFGVGEIAADVDIFKKGDNIVLDLKFPQP